MQGIFIGTFLIGLREGLEATLIVSVIGAFLTRNGKSVRPMVLGVGLAVVISIAVGVGPRRSLRVAASAAAGDARDRHRGDRRGVRDHDDHLDESQRLPDEGRAGTRSGTGDQRRRRTALARWPSSRFSRRVSRPRCSCSRRRRPRKAADGSPCSAGRRASRRRSPSAPASTSASLKLDLGSVLPHHRRLPGVHRRRPGDEQPAHRPRGRLGRRRANSESSTSPRYGAEIGCRSGRHGHVRDPARPTPDRSARLAALRSSRSRRLPLAGQVGTRPGGETTVDVRRRGGPRGARGRHGRAHPRGRQPGTGTDEDRADRRAAAPSPQPCTPTEPTGCSPSIDPAGARTADLARPRRPAVGRRRRRRRMAGEGPCRSRGRPPRRSASAQLDESHRRAPARSASARPAPRGRSTRRGARAPCTRSSLTATPSSPPSGPAAAWPLSAAAD